MKTYEILANKVDKTPAYVIDEAKLIHNLEILKGVEERSGARILLAQKAFSSFTLYPLIGRYLSGTTASGLYEARLGAEAMGKENHVFAPAYKKADMEELVKLCDHIIFNSFRQFEVHREVCLRAGVSLGIRVNPECRTQEDHAIYDPCAPGSRLGVTREQFPDRLPEGIEGLHFHTLCEQNSDDLVTTFKAFEARFGKYLPGLKWLNMGGGHHITREDYDIDTLVDLVRYIKETYDLEVYLEPGEAIALNAGYLVTEVMDIVHNDLDILILDASAACHMPDVLEMPYRPPLYGAYEAREKACSYRISSATCLAGDVIGDYSFDQPVKIGDRLIFEDMAIYSMVKNNTFNGIPLPDICLLTMKGEISLIRQFGYEDFKGRLGPASLVEAGRSHTEGGCAMIPDRRPTEDGFYMPGEFEAHQACILVWPERPGSWIYGARAARRAFTEVIKGISASEKVYVAVSEAGQASARQALAGLANVEIFLCETDDSWARDIGPTFLVGPSGGVRGVNWEFNAWGGAFDGLYRDYDKDNQFAGRVADHLGFDCYDAAPFVLEGGSIHSDGQGTILVTESCLLSPGRNPHMTREEIEDTLCSYLGGRKVLWLPRGIYQDETNEHVDNVCAFIRPGEVVLAWTDNKEDPQYELSKACLDYLAGETDACGRQILVHKLPVPDHPVCVTEEELSGYSFEEGEDEREVGERLAASYVNFYFSNDHILLPQFGGENEESDRRAVEILSGLCPERTIWPVYARDILVGGGNIHCITQQVPAGRHNLK